MTTRLSKGWLPTCARWLSWITACLLFLESPQAWSLPHIIHPGQEGALDAEARTATIDKVTSLLGELYVFPDVANEMRTFVQERLEAGVYDAIISLDDLVQALTNDLQSVSHDRHLTVRSIPRVGFGEELLSEAELQRRFMEELRYGNFGFESVERLPGNVGYLDLRGFSDVSVAGPTAVGTMGFLASSDALIIDLRQNGGGSPSMIQLISSYFFDEKVHLNSFYTRKDDTLTQFWTQEHVPGRLMTEVPIYVLTSSRTFSAGEEFAYNLKHLGRATIVGETTGGGAHPVESHFFPELGISVGVPFGRAVNPITGTNWEGVGVEPDILVAAEEALVVAHLQVLEDLLDAETDEHRKARLTWDHQGVLATREPVGLDASRLAGYQGSYGSYTVRLEGSELYLTSGRTRYRLHPMGEHLFAAEGLDRYRFRFSVSESGVFDEIVRFSERGERRVYRRVE